MRGIFMSVTTMEGDKAMPLFQSFDAVAGRLRPVTPGGKQLRQTGAFVLFIFHDQYFFLAHRWQEPYDVIIEATC